MMDDETVRFEYAKLVEQKINLLEGFFSSYQKATLIFFGTSVIALIFNSMVSELVFKFLPFILFLCIITGYYIWWPARSYCLLKYKYILLYKHIIIGHYKIPFDMDVSSISNEDCANWMLSTYKRTHPNAHSITCWLYKHVAIPSLYTIIIFLSIYAALLYCMFL